MMCIRISIDHLAAACRLLGDVRVLSADNVWARLWVSPEALARLRGHVLWALDGSLPPVPDLGAVAGVLADHVITTQPTPERSLDLLAVTIGVLEGHLEACVRQVRPRSADYARRLSDLRVTEATLRKAMRLSDRMMKP